MIYIVIDNAEYPSAKVLGIYKDYDSAYEKWQSEFDHSDPYGTNVEMIQWDIVKNVEVEIQHDDNKVVSLVD